MDHDFSDVQPSEIEFKESIFHNRYSEVFLVQIRGTICVMKVHRDQGPPPLPLPSHRQGEITDIHLCEVTAYHRLMHHGLGDQGIVPRYYGEIRQLDVKDYQPHLKRFLDEELPPSAIFLEYIPNMVGILPEHYTKERVDFMIHGIQQIHKALVLHSDMHPRNIKILEDDPTRVVWIDFDRAQAFHANKLTDIQRKWFEMEEQDVHTLADLLKEDHALGRIHHTIVFY